MRTWEEVRALSTRVRLGLPDGMWEQVFPDETEIVDVRISFEEEAVSLTLKLKGWFYLAVVHRGSRSFPEPLKFDLSAPDFWSA